MPLYPPATTTGYTPGGTDVAVADGGTGASTAAAAATNLGLGTGDSPQFTAVNIGAATDTTLARTGAGDIAVEGNALYRVGGTDVAVADGGTGSSTAGAARTALGAAAATDVTDHTGDTVDAHDASAISVADAGSLLTATEVEAALQEFGLKVVGYSAHGNTGSTETFSALTGWHSATLNAACTFTLTAAPTGTSSNLLLELLQDGTGGWAITLPASVTNKTALEAAQVTTLSTTSFLALWSRDGGTTWYGAWVGASTTADSDATVTFTDITTNNASTSKHGFLKKLSNVSTEYMSGTGVWSTPGGTGSVASDTIWDAAGDLVQGTGADTAAKLSAGTAGYVLTSNGAAAAISWQAAAGGSSSLLAVAQYAPGSTQVLSTASTSMVDVDATNMKVTFTAPASGNVLVRVSAFSDMNSGAGDGYWGLRESTTNLGGIARILRGAGDEGYTSVEFYITGVTGGSHTYKWSYGVGSGTTRIIVEDGSAIGEWGPGIMSVWGAP